MTEELRQAMQRCQQLQRTQQYLEMSLPTVTGFPVAHESVKRALRVVAREAGRALARVKRLQQIESDEQDPAA